MYSAYCPWCGAEITPQSFSPRTEDIEWEPCRTPRCKGGLLTLVTDMKGFVIHPNHIRGRYVYSRNNDEDNGRKK